MLSARVRCCADVYGAMTRLFEDEVDRRGAGDLVNKGLAGLFQNALKKEPGSMYFLEYSPQHVADMTLHFERVPLESHCLAAATRTREAGRGQDMVIEVRNAPKTLVLLCDPQYTGCRGCDRADRPT